MLLKSRFISISYKVDCNFYVAYNHPSLIPNHLYNINAQIEHKEIHISVIVAVKWQIHL